MARNQKLNYQALIEDQLRTHPEGLTLDQMLEHAELKVDRSTLFRHLARLIEQDRVQRIGNARASRYLLRAAGAAGTAPTALDSPAVQPPALAPSQPAVPPAAPPARANIPPAAEDQSRPSFTAEPGPAATAQPDPVVAKAVRKIVREWKRCSRMNLEIYLSLLVKPEQQDRLAAVVEKELVELNEGNLHRFGLSLEEFRDFVPPEGASAN